MEITRRAFIRNSLQLSSFAALLSLAPVVIASPRESFVTIVEIANFQCSNCRAMNDHFGRIQAEAALNKIDLLFAPSALEGQSLWPNRFYYSARDLYPEAERIFRDAIFEGIHSDGQPFETLMQVIAYFNASEKVKEIQKLYPSFEWDSIIVRAESDEPLYSEIKAGKLIELASVEEVPSFLWLKDAQLSDVQSPAQAPEMGRLAQLVIDSIKNSSKN